MPILKSTIAPALALLLAATGTPTPSRAQDAPATTPAANPEAFRQALVGFTDWVASQPTLQVDAQERWQVRTGDDPKLAESGGNRYQFVAQRPGKFAVRVWPGEAKTPSVEAAGDGETVVTRLAADKALHARDRQREPLESLRRNPLLAQALAGSFLDLLMRPDLVEYATAAVADPTDLGTEGTGADALRHIRGRLGDGRQVDVWITAQAPVQVRRIDTVLAVSGARPESPVTRVETRCDYTWKTADAVDTKALAATIPPGSTEVDDLYAAATGAGETLKVGTPAPALDLELLGGGKLNLKAHVGRDIVVLNFWATWFPTGVESLPTIAAFAKEFQERGVVIYNLNMAEPADLVERYVKAQPYTMTVVLDPDGVALEPYAVRALPFSVVIGKDGAIRAVNAGDLRGFKDRFRQQIEEALAGK